MTTTTSDLLDLGDEEFVALTTFRASGRPVRTPVWVVRDGEALVVTTPSRSGKVKRLRHDSRVELRPCSRRGRVEPGAPRVSAAGVVDPDRRAHDSVAPLFEEKYGWQFRVAMVLERAIRRFRPTAGPLRRVVRLTAD